MERWMDRGRNGLMDGRINWSLDEQTNGWFFIFFNNPYTSIQQSFVKFTSFSLRQLRNIVTRSHILLPDAESHNSNLIYMCLSKRYFEKQKNICRCMNWHALRVFIRGYLFTKHFPGVHFGEWRLSIKLNLWEHPVCDNSVWHLQADTWTGPNMRASKCVLHWLVAQKAKKTLQK